MRLNILYISPYLPCFGKSGAQSKMFEELQMLTKENFVFLVCFCVSEEKDSVGLLRDMGCRVYPVFIKNYARIPRNNRDFSKAVHFLIESEKIDIVQCEFSFMADYVPSVKNMVRILFKHQIFFASFLRQGKFEKNFFYKGLLLLRSIKNIIDEKRRILLFDKVIFLSEEDRVFFRKWVDKNIDSVIIPMGIDCHFFKSLGDKEEKYDACFVGNFAHRPNLDGLWFFLTEILPGIRLKLPRFSFLVCGHNIPQRAIEKFSEDVFWVHSPSDIRHFILQSKIFINPVRFGSGVRRKVLEAWALERAVVSTSIGAEGLDTREGENIFIADSPQEFVNKIVMLMEDKVLRERLGEAGRKTVEERYGIIDYSKKMDDIYRELVS